MDTEVRFFYRLPMKMYISVGVKTNLIYTEHRFPPGVTKLHDCLSWQTAFSYLKKAISNNSKIEELVLYQSDWLVRATHVGWWDKTENMCILLTLERAEKAPDHIASSICTSLGRKRILQILENQFNFER